MEQQLPGANNRGHHRQRRSCGNRHRVRHAGTGLYRLGRRPDRKSPHRSQQAKQRRVGWTGRRFALRAREPSQHNGHACQSDGAVEELGLKLPLFVPCLLMGLVLSNTIPFLFPRLTRPTRTRALAVLSDYCLSSSLAMSHMSTRLWTLQGLGGPLVGILAAQVICTVLFIMFLFPD